jgi:hypothetical protein
MLVLRPLILMLVLLACASVGVSRLAAQGGGAGGPTRPAPAPARPDTSTMRPMVFYHAHGGDNACGPGCSEWIAAEGKIDAGSPGRLQHLLTQLHGARLPIFFNSPGGRVTASMEIGRLIRARALTVSVGHTIPLDCIPGSAASTPCDTNTGAGQHIEAELDPFTAMCNSGCVYAVMGGKVRLIPPWVRLGIHDVSVDPQFRGRLSAQVVEAIEDVAKSRLHTYVLLMGIDERILSEAFAVPSTTVEFLSRDDTARFGLDRREFGETVWRFISKPTPAIRKDFFVHARNKEPRYIDGLLNLSCGTWPGSRYVLTFARKLLPSDPAAVPAQPAIGIRVNDKEVSLLRRQDAKFYVRATLLMPTALDGIADKASIFLPRTELGGEAGQAGDITLAMDGFSAVYSKLQKACPPVAHAVPALPLPKSVNQTAPFWPNRFGADLPDGKQPAHQPNAVEGDFQP